MAFSTKRLDTIANLLNEKLRTSQTLSVYLTDSHKYSDEDTLHMREAHFITSIEPGKTATMSEVAESLLISLSAASQIGARLEKKGYIVRSRSEEDRRVVCVSLTEKGEEFRKEHIIFDENEFRELDALLISDYTDEQLEMFLDYERRMNAWFSRKDKQ